MTHPEVNLNQRQVPDLHSQIRDVKMLLTVAPSGSNTENALVDRLVQLNKERFRPTTPAPHP